MLKTKIKKRKCAHCRNEFVPARPMQKVCSIDCAVALLKRDILKRKASEEKQGRKNLREAKERIKTRGDHLRELQTIFNAWIRLRDHGQPCISCQRHHKGQYHAGHYRSVGSEPALRFSPDNVHLQCQPCNTHLSGNLIPYRVNLIKKIGLDRVEWLEGKHEPIKLTIDEIKQMKSDYR
ncbi:MAG: recombination protein NinG, partial [Pseudomonadota bacterium]|nr:recombination protein NinG [Pseudomonadota bacterium]